MHSLRRPPGREIFTTAQVKLSRAPTAWRCATLWILPDFHWLRGIRFHGLAQHQALDMVPGRELVQALDVVPWPRAV
ncbi:hypothetical protein [Hyalangium minutum]|uniref:hypothetical protein n=1 Tax=Hyalangium minutum TaxID=394096 RepID=UPI0012F780AF|nr:hypothetical protein [Hyalangium minutum]